MGLTFIAMRVMNSAKPKKSEEIRFLVDSGAMYSLVPAVMLRKLGIKPEGVKEFVLANGEVIRRSIGNALFEYNDERRASPVIFGEGKDDPLVGVVTLESFGYVLDPLRRELRPAKLLLG